MFADYIQTGSYYSMQNLNSEMLCCILAMMLLLKFTMHGCKCNTSSSEHRLFTHDLVIILCIFALNALLFFFYENYISEDSSQSSVVPNSFAIF